MGILSAKGDYAHSSRKRLNAYNVWMMLFVSIGSLCYGYTANVISATLGNSLSPHTCENSISFEANGATRSPAQFQHVFQSGRSSGRPSTSLRNERHFPDRRCHWNT